MRNRFATLAVLFFSSAIVPALADEFPPCGTFVLWDLDREAQGIDFGKKGESVFDERAGEVGLADSSGNKVDTLRFLGTVVDVEEGEVDDDVTIGNIIFTLPDGTIHTSTQVRLSDMLAVEKRPSPLSAIAVIGGTGAYARSKGEVLYTRGERPKREFRLNCD
jgi:hypothetical protein